jgi:dihydroorotate dehydrogenase (NAD+) catalytic subunit
MFPLKHTLGALITKTVTPQPRLGNPQPRTVELPGIGMLNSIGLQNPGLAACLAEELPELVQHQVPVMVSISADSTEAFTAMAEALAARPEVAALEVNLSCPNIARNGLHFGDAPETVTAAISAVRAGFSGPVFAKLTPNVTSIVAIGEAALAGGATGLTAINTVMGIKIDVKRRRPVLPRQAGGYSGPGIRPVAVLAVWRLWQAFPGIPIVGVGGIACLEDVLEFLMAGASAVQIGTWAFRHPMIFPNMVQDLAAFLETQGVAHVSQLVGCAHATG